MRSAGKPTAMEFALVAVMFSDEYPEEFERTLASARDWLAEVRERRDVRRALGPDAPREIVADRLWALEREHLQRLTSHLDAAPAVAP